MQKILYHDHYVVLGWNVSGTEAVETLLHRHSRKLENKIVLINDLNAEEIEELQQRFKEGNLTFLKGDYTGTAVLNRARVEYARAVLILPDRGLDTETADERAVLATLAVKSVNSKVKVFVQILRRESESHLRRAGVDRVIVADKYNGQLLANCAVAPNIPIVLDSLLSISRGPSFTSVKPPKEFIGSSFEEYARYLKREKDCILIGFVTEESILGVEDILSDDISSVDAFIQKKLLRAGRSPEELETTFVNLNPPFDYMVGENDFAIVVGGR